MILSNLFTVILHCLKELQYCSASSSLYMKCCKQICIHLNERECDSTFISLLFISCLYEILTLTLIRELIDSWIFSVMTSLQRAEWAEMSVEAWLWLSFHMTSKYQSFFLFHLSTTLKEHFMSHVSLWRRCREIEYRCNIESFEINKVSKQWTCATIALVDK